MFAVDSDDDEPLVKYRKRYRTEDTQQLEIFPSLHEDIVVSIVQWLSVKKLIQLESVCRRWKDVLIPRSFGKAKRKFLSLTDTIRLYRYRTCEWLNWRNSSGDNSIDGFRILSKLLDLMGTHLTCIKLLYSDHKIGAEEFQLLTTKCPNLRAVEMYKWGIIEDYPWQLPASITSVNLTGDVLQPAILDEFFRTHPRLSQFRWKTVSSSPDLPQRLAQYCSGLTHLSISCCVETGWNFAGVFSSLNHLQVLELDINKCFTTENLKDLCANCLDLEGFSLCDRIESPLTVANALLFGGLKKLKRLELKSCSFTDKSLSALCEIVGAKLEYLVLSVYSLTDVSLHIISRHCRNLTKLRFLLSRYTYASFSPEEMTKFIEEITSDTSWKDPVKNRHIRIEVDSDNRIWLWAPRPFNHINLDRYEGRVELVQW